MDLITRVAATEKTVSEFYEMPFEWGTRDCAILAARHLENCGFATRLNECRKYRSAKGAKRAMLLLGAESMEDFIDAYGFERIAPASTLPGDLVGFPGGEDDDPWTALGVVTDPGEHLIGFALGMCMRGPVKVATVAWRVA